VDLETGDGERHRVDSDLDQHVPQFTVALIEKFPARLPSFL
jgi:hypothetical protein